MVIVYIAAALAGALATVFFFNSWSPLLALLAAPLGGGLAAGLVAIVASIRSRTVGSAAGKPNAHRVLDGSHTQG